jgi:large subunit ribosomal protein L19
MDIMKTIDDGQRRQTPLDEFQVGDTVDVYTRIREGDKERIQIFTGTVLRTNRTHHAPNASFTVRRIVDGEGVERIFPVNSPLVTQVKVVRKGSVRRSKLYYLRDRVGKRTKVKELVRAKNDLAAPAAD